MEGSSTIIYILLLLLLLYSPTIKQKINTLRRRLAIRQLETRYNARFITIIHRQESSGILGLSTSGYLTIEDAQEVTKAIYLTPPNMPIYLVIQTPGGIALAAEQIARALKAHEAEVKVFVPFMAMSGGTMIALAADKIHMTEHAVLGAVDPQLPVGWFNTYPAASILESLNKPNLHREDSTLILGDISRKAIDQITSTVEYLLDDHPKAKTIAEQLATGKHTHDYPITYERALSFGLPVAKGIPEDIYNLMKLYKTSSVSINYISEPYAKTRHNLWR